MTRIENTQAIRVIVMKPTAITKCKIGQDWYKNELEIKMMPDRYYPDYMEVEKWIMENIDGKELNIEDVVDMIYTYIKSYGPLAVNVIDRVTGNKVHFDVVVEK